MLQKGSHGKYTHTFPEGLECTKNLQAQFKVHWRYIDCIATQRCSVVTWNSQKLMLIKGTQVLLPSPWKKEPGKKMDSPVKTHKCIHSPLRGSSLISTSVATGQAGGEVLTHSTGEDRNHSCPSEGGQGGGGGYVEHWDLVRPFPPLW